MEMYKRVLRFYVKMNGLWNVQSVNSDQHKVNIFLFSKETTYLQKKTFITHNSFIFQSYFRFFCRFFSHDQSTYSAPTLSNHVIKNESKDALT